jgi:hypothetical protein
MSQMFQQIRPHPQTVGLALRRVSLLRPKKMLVEHLFYPEQQDLCSSLILIL